MEQLIKFLHEEMLDVRNSLALGQWTGESGARELVGKYQAYNATMQKINELQELMDE